PRSSPSSTCSRASAWRGRIRRTRGSSFAGTSARTIAAVTRTAASTAGPGTPRSTPLSRKADPAPRGDRLLVQAAGPVGRAHQRTAHHPGEAEILGLLAQLHKLLLLHPALNPVVQRRWP